MTTQPEALRLAALIDSDFDPDWMHEQGYDQIAAELRRLHERDVEWQRISEFRQQTLEKIHADYGDRIAALETALGVAVEAMQLKQRVTMWESDLDSQQFRQALATARQTLGGKHD